MDDDLSFFSGDGTFGEVKVGVAHGSNAADVGGHETWDVIGFWCIGSEEVMFQEGLAHVFGIEAFLGGNFNGEGACLGVKELSEGVDGFILREDRGVVDFDNVGTANLVAGGLVG